MPISEPGWWYGEGDGGWMARLLNPASRIFAALATSRIENATSYHSRLPVICVGNFTAGGTGKTPLTIHIARLLIEAGEHPVILTRGYGGRRTGPCWIEDGTELAEDVGDEPLLLARAAPTLISRDRRAGAIAAETTTKEGGRAATVIVMDDGLQNPSLAKDFSIAIVDGVRGFGNGMVIPAGPLRAPLEVQLRHTDAVLVNIPPNSMAVSSGAASTRQGDGVPPTILERLKREFQGPVLTASAEAAAPVDDIAERHVVAYAGIANPARFFALVERHRGIVVARRVFKDHHAFTETDADELLDLAGKHGARLVTTEKDHVRLLGYGGARERLARESVQVPIRLAFEHRDAMRLAGLVGSAVAEARKRRGQ